MTIDLTQVKELTEEIRKMYRIKIYEEYLHIYHPAFISIRFDESFDIRERGSTIEIRNSKALITLWKNTDVMSIVIL